MYQTNIYLQARILLSAVPGVFNVKEKEGNKDILTAKATFLDRNNKSFHSDKVELQPSVLHKLASLVHALGSSLIQEGELDYIEDLGQEVPDDKNFTGYSLKVAAGGYLEFNFHQRNKRINIEEIRIEEDRGRLTRSGGKTHMDWTYAGCPSLLIKTSPSFELGEEAELFLNELYTLSAYLNLITGDLAESAIRCNAYVSICQYGTKADYTVKLRNLNSFNFVRKAINVELTRQEEILSSGGNLTSESRLWIAEKGITESYRSRKEKTSKIKRFSPPVKVSIPTNTSFVQTELPSARRARLKKTYGLSSLRALFICGEKDRADYFEQAVEAGSPPLLTARWIASELMKVLNLHKTSIKMGLLTASKFASIMKMLENGKISSEIAKKLIAKLSESGEDAESIVEREGWTLLSSDEELLPLVKEVLEEAENKKSVELLRKGDMAPLEYLTGCVMKKSRGRALAQRVKALIKESLKISVVYVFTMGGTITAQKMPDGSVVALKDFEQPPAFIKGMLSEANKAEPIIITPVRSMLSEETEPADWAELIALVKDRIESGTANGIVITHGTDTLPYTSALLFWLFGAAEVPIVLTASRQLPGTQGQSADNLNFAIETAKAKKSGVYVVYNKTIYSPLNLKFLNTSAQGFANWNMSSPNQKQIFSYEGPLTSTFMSVTAPESSVMARLLNEAAEKMLVLRLYPGLHCYKLNQLLDNNSGIETLILELYANGTGNMRRSDYSLKEILLNSRRHFHKVYCTSQQECSVDFSEYSTSAGLRREGAVPMGFLTTESAVALYFASYLLADSREELADLMENFVTCLS